MTTQQSYALYLADELELGTFVPNVLQNEAALRQRAAAELRRQHTRITELESQLAQRFDAADMATAAAQGFRDGVASVSAGSEPVAWQYRSVRDKGLWFDCTEERAQQRAAHPDKWDVRYLYTHPYPKEGMAGWTKASEQLPPCRDDQDYIGINTAGFDAADMATAAAQGFRDGVAPVSAVSEPVAWKHDCAALLANDVELWIDACPHCGKPRMHATQAAHPSPPGGMGAAKEQQAGAFQRALSIRTAQGWKLGGDKVPVLYTDEINGEQVCRDDVWLCTTAALASPPTAQAGSEPVASCAIRLLVAADLITQAKANEALRLAAEITAAPATADGESK